MNLPHLMFPLAHAGHWLTGIAYFTPVLGFIGWIVVTRWRERRKGDGRS